MLIIWGNKGYEKELGKTNITTECTNCRNYVTYVGKEYGKKFTLFWIPLFTTSKSAYAVCPICRQGFQMTKEDVNKYLTNDI